MSFLGSASTKFSLCSYAAGTKPAECGFPLLVSHRAVEQRLAIWGKAQVVHSGELGILLEGRIFNSTDLARQLDLDSQDELHLLLHAYRRWGAEFPKYLEGEYSFVLWDGQARRILLGRDPTGYRTLFYMRLGEELRFTSEIRHLFHFSDTRIRLDENHMAHWLATTPTRTNSTFFQDIVSLPPGHVLLFGKGRPVLSDFWQPEKLPALRLRDSREYACGLLEVLRTAIRDRLRSVAVVGSQMSGGLDSSSVTALAAGVLQPQNRRLYAFTAVPDRPPAHVPGRFCDEGPHAASVAALYSNVDHVLVPHGRHSAFAMIDRFSQAEQQPILNPANYDWIYEICLQARQREMDTLLIGAAGNFSISYTGAHALPSLLQQGRLLQAALLANSHHRNGNMRWRGIAYQTLSPWLPEWTRRAIEHVRNGRVSFAGETLIREEFARSHGLDPMARQRYFHGSDARLFRLAGFRRIDIGPFIEGFRQTCGISMTDPTMDRRVVEYCFSIPVEYFCENGVPRSLIRNAMMGLLPDQVRMERRKGLQAAGFTEHFRAERQEALDELARMKKVDLAARALDLSAMENMMQWSDDRIATYGHKVNYWPKLMRGFSLGRFLRRLEEGTLLTIPEEAPKPGASSSNEIPATAI